MTKKISLISAAIFALAACAPDSSFQPSALRCEYFENPMCIDDTSPELSWVNLPGKGVANSYQTAYQIVVADSEVALRKGGKVWDSGKVESGESHIVTCGAAQLLPGRTYWWKVRTWDEKDRVSDWSEPAYWGMGLLSPDNWEAKWIGAPWQGEKVSDIQPTKRSDPYLLGHSPAPLFTKEFTIEAIPECAKLFISGLGCFEAYINGRRVGEDYFVPGFTDYSFREGLDRREIPQQPGIRGYRTFYMGYDVSGYLKKGVNEISVLLGNAYFANVACFTHHYGSPRIAAQLEFFHRDGVRELVCTDESWEVSESPIVINDLYKGEVYDARLEGKAEKQPVVLRKAPDGALTANESPADRIISRYEPVSFVKTDSSYIVEFPYEISGWVSLKGLKGEKGDTLRVRYLPEYFTGQSAYIFKGEGLESYKPRFHWFTFSKVEILGVTELTPEQTVAEMVSADIATAAEFECSNRLFEQINEIWRRSQRDNMHFGVASDCPHRERLPYTGDGQVTMNTVLSNFDAAAFYRKWIEDIRLSQNVESGHVPNGAPWESTCGGGIPWGAAICIMPWEFYQFYGDMEVLSENYFAMKEYIRYMKSWSLGDGTILARATDPEGNELQWLNLGDWGESFGLPDLNLVHTFYLWLCEDITSKVAAVLGDSEGASEYAAMAAETSRAFHRKFRGEGDAFSLYGDFGGKVFAIVCDPSEEQRAEIAASLREEVGVKYNSHLNTGVMALRYFFEALADNGMNDLAYACMNQRDFPSYGYWIEQGATTTWEYWDGQHSHNHPFQGSGLGWLYHKLAGVRPDPDAPGFRHVFIAPVDTPEVEHVKYSLETPYGRLCSEINRKADVAELLVTVPVGSSATVILPDGQSHDVAQGCWNFEWKTAAGTERVRINH